MKKIMEIVKTVEINDINYEKNEIRKRIKEINSKFCKDYIKASDAAIINNVLNSKEYKEASTVFCFVGTRNEINTYPIIQHCFQSGKLLCVPKCLEPGHMEAYIINSLDDLKVGKYNIMEPKSTCIKIQKEKIDICIVPCISCNTHGHRLGHGGGYYDRYLEDFSGRKIILCRKKLMWDHIPVDEHDMNMDKLITEKNIYDFK